jgi:oligosaccharide repeat unit polymerase
MILSVVTLIVLIGALIVQWRRYGTKLLLHPSAYFLVMWTISVISFILFYIAGLELILYEKYLNELFIFLIFTSLCFVFWGHKGYKPIRVLPVRINLYIPFQIFGFFAYAIFINSLVGLLTQGFDVAQNREMVNVELAENIVKDGIRSSLIIGIIKMLSLPFTVYSGWRIGNNFIRGENIKYIYFLPLAASLMDTITDGGRAGIISAFLIFIIGFLMGFFSMPMNYNYKRAFRPLLKYGLIFFLAFSLYSGFVSNQRSLRESGAIQSRYTSILLNEFPGLNPVAGILEYLVFHFQGYQWRRADFEGNDFEFGQNTFSFITNFNVPVVSQLYRTQISLQSAFKLKYMDTVKSTMEGKQQGIIAHSITATVFMVLYTDFGFWGTLLFIFFFVGLTQFLFKRLFFKNNTSFWAIILFIVVYRLWTQTFFSHHLNGVWLNSYIYPLILLEILRVFVRTRKKKVPVVSSSVSHQH